MVAIGSELLAGLVMVGIVVAALVTNYVAVTIQERRDGTTARRAEVPPGSIAWDAIRHPEFRSQFDGGRTIEAIKTYRELTGAGLKESKDVVDYLRTHPGLLDPPAPPAGA